MCPRIYKEVDGGRWKQSWCLFLTLLLVSTPICLVLYQEPYTWLEYPDTSYPYSFYMPTRNFSVPLPNPIPNPVVSAFKRTIHSRSRNITFPVKATSPWPRYRLGDMFKASRWRKGPSGWFLHSRRFKTSIAVEYMKRIDSPFRGTAGDSDYSTMMDIVNERIRRNTTLQSLLPDNQTLVVHLRTGDVIDNNDIPVREYLSWNVKYHDRNYSRGLPFYAEIWDRIQSEHLAVDGILVVTGWHVQRPHFRSIAYINEMIKYFEQMVDRVDLRVNENPDEDFVIMSRSTLFVKSGGGFSKMISEMVQRNGGRVFE